mgnify:CR=1 FL=1
MTASRSLLLSRKLVSKLKKSTSSYNWGGLFRECKTTNLGVGSSNLPERAIPRIDTRRTHSVSTCSHHRGRTNCPSIFQSIYVSLEKSAQWPFLANLASLLIQPNLKAYENDAKFQLWRAWGGFLAPSTLTRQPIHQGSGHHAVLLV